jgi:hypothetical protein
MYRDDIDYSDSQLPDSELEKIHVANRRAKHLEHYEKSEISRIRHGAGFPGGMSFPNDKAWQNHQSNIKQLRRKLYAGDY